MYTVQTLCIQYICTLNLQTRYIYTCTGLILTSAVVHGKLHVLKLNLTLLSLNIDAGWR